MRCDMIACNCKHLFLCVPLSAQVSATLMDSDSIDLSFGFQMEEEVDTSLTDANAIGSSCKGPPVLDSSKCLWCQTVTNEKASKLGTGLETFIKNCQVMGKSDLVAHVTRRSNTNHLLHRGCNRSLAYAVRRAKCDALSS